MNTYVLHLHYFLISTFDNIGYLCAQGGKVNVWPFNNRRFRDCFKRSRNYKQTNGGAAYVTLCVAERGLVLVDPLFIFINLESCKYEN